MKKKMVTAMLYIMCRVNHYYGHIKFKFNNIISLYTNNDSERRRSVNYTKCIP